MKTLSSKIILIGLFVFLQFSKIEGGVSNCAGVLVDLHPRIERLFGIPVKVLDAAIEVRERTVGDLKVVSLERLFAGKNEIFLGFGLPNVFTTVPDRKDGYEKFAAKSLRREDAKVEDTRGFVQSGIFLRFKNLPEEAVEGLQAAIQDPKNHIRHWTCVNANCQVFQQAGFHLQNGKRLDSIYFPVKLLKTLIRHGLYYEGKRVEFDIIRTSPSFLNCYGIRQVWAEVDTLRRHSKKANPIIGKILYAPDPIIAWMAKKILPKSPSLEPWIKDTPIADLPLAQATSLKLKVSSTSTATSLLAQLWGAHNLYEIETTDSAAIDSYLPHPLKEFDRPQKDFFTLLKQYFLFSPQIVGLVRRALVKSLIDVGSQSVADLHAMLPVHSDNQPAQYNLVVTPEAITVAYLNAGKSKTLDWLLTKHVLVSGYAPDVRFAGIIWKGEDGRIYVSNDSGTYRPSDENLDRIVAYLKTQLPGVDMIGVKAHAKGAEASNEGPAQVESAPSRFTAIFQKLKGLDRAYFTQVSMIKEIYRTSKKIEKIKVALKDISTIHDMEGVGEAKTKARAQAFIKNRDAILSLGFLSIEEQQRLAPSEGNMRVVRDRQGKFILFDGNGRFKAIKLAFGDAPNFELEVEYIETSSESVLADLDWIRNFRGLAN